MEYILKEQTIVNPAFSPEPKLLGTAGAIANINKLYHYDLGDALYRDFLVVNGDTITNVNYTEMFKLHEEKGNIATVFTHDDFIHSGGTYIFNKEIFKYIPKGVYSIHEQLIPDLIKKKIPITEYRSEAYYFDTATPEKLEKARRFLKKLK